MPLTRPAPAMLSMNSRSDPAPFSPSFHPTVTFTLTAGGLLSPKIKCTTDNKKDCYTFQNKSDSSSRNMTVKDYKSNQVCKIKSKGEHLLDLYLTTDSKDINVQFRDMVAFKKAVEKNALQYKRVNAPYSSDFEYDRPDRFLTDISSSGNGNTCWAFEFEGQIYQWTAGNGQGIMAPPGSDVLLCHSASLGPATKVAKLQSSHTGASDKLIIFAAATAHVLDKTGLHILLLASVLSLTEIMNERSRELIDFD
ncbi:hypothetical protein BKA57DRAFT_431922 [Linnemannia elongata]|uniref:Uncharacterized protein n=1 Tax=Linnemannia elongata AG-77 TaxID=1314771 RepID=A0A197KH95_9FUNG|nr:hypothetical protein BGZ88_011833 [Linnemannia elongata]KAH7059601.1 hypothetical protein BKA57DRAFT_431922 [Linnemannia elongata]KAK5828725.1 hypothetical protein F5H01DRAFT_360608 [Linnemannia elongata]OAQ36523.1 hypothetical protein K457DRAFT_119885 [Linnemannia elongata AG-77]